MRYLILIIILTLFAFEAFSQRTNLFKIGLGYPLITGVESDAAEQVTVTSFPMVSFEMPIPFEINRDDKVTLNPGVSLFYLKDEEVRNYTNTGGTRDFNNISFNGYLKAFYRVKLKRRSEAFVYFGGIIGGHIYTRTIGNEVIYSADQVNNLERDVNESGKEFFNTPYYGGIVGFQPNAKITNRYKLSVEAGYYPNFISLRTHDANALMVTVLVGINK